jgi:hypothetical protein
MHTEGIYTIYMYIRTYTIFCVMLGNLCMNLFLYLHEQDI